MWKTEDLGEFGLLVGSRCGKELVGFAAFAGFFVY